MRVAFLAHLLPPRFDRSHRERRCVVIDADKDERAVVGDVVDPVRDRLANGVAGEVGGLVADVLELRVSIRMLLALDGLEELAAFLPSA